MSAASPLVVPPDVLYVEALAAPDTINTMPDQTLLAFADHGTVKSAMPPSAPATELLRQYGFTVENICARAKALLP
jgi:transaldolase